MNKLLAIFFMAACFIMSACSEDEPKDRSELIRMWVSAETTETYVCGDDNHENPIECMQVKYSLDGTWEPMMFGTIEYFQYEKGVECELSVIRTTLSEPSADGTSFGTAQSVVSNECSQICNFAA